MFWLFISLGLVVLALAVAAGYLWVKVWRLEKQQKLQQQEYEKQKVEAEQKRLDYIHESLNVIARAVLDGQCPVTEGCIRMAVLLDNLPLDCDSKHRFSVIFEVYNVTRHIPTHDNWKSLSRKEQRRFEQEMFALEKQHLDAVQEAMAYVRDHPFGSEPRSSLH